MALMWKALICDDDPAHGEGLRDLLVRDAQLRVSCVGSVEALEQEMASGRQPDLLFLDIRLGREDGIQFVQRMSGQLSGAQVIYVTGYVEYCTKVYDTEHLSFLLKPVSSKELWHTVDRAKERLVRQRSQGLTLQCRSAVQFLLFSQIRYLESRGRRVRLVTEHGVYESYGKLSDLRAQMDGRFFQCHKSFLVNTDYIRQLGHTHFILFSGEQIPISSRRRAEAKQCFLHTLRAAAGMTAEHRGA